MSLHAQRCLGRLGLSRPLYTTASSTVRPFTCTAAQGYSLPPESPDYIPVPTPPLSEEKKPTRVRGSLPVPRKVFPQPSDSRKLERSYFEETYPRSEKPRPAAVTEDPDHPQAWKRVMAESRRKNLRSGLKGLWRRKVKRDDREAALGANRLKAHVEVGLAAESTDDFLTRSTVLEETLRTEIVADPQRFDKAEASKARTEQKMARDREERQQALMELYMNANKFIVDEAALNAEVEHVFSDDYWRDPSRNSAWHEWGNQTGIYGMVGRAARDAPTNAVENYTADYARNMKRQKRTAEELTGGKMD